MDIDREIIILNGKIHALVGEISQMKVFRAGTLVERYRKCGKSYCHCSQENHPGHGPSWSLTRTIKGKTVTQIIPETEVATIKEQIDEYHRFQECTRQLIEVNTLICDLRLKQSKDEKNRQKEAEKRGFKKQSRKNSRQK